MTRFRNQIIRSPHHQIAKRCGAAVACALALWCAGASGRAQAPTQLPVYSYALVKAYPHDKDAFTQGLEIVDGYFYEGTGLVGKSSIRKVRLATGEVLQQKALPDPHFGEGITLFGGRLFQLTWQSGTAFVYDPATFRQLRSFKYTGEGWGLTHNQTQLVMSDGSDQIRFINPTTFQETRRIRVTGLGQSLRNINELEWVKGEIFANVWMTDYIARIDPATGKLNGYIDLRGLMPAGTVSADAVLNGIAYDEKSDRLFVTGKLWPRVFEIKIGPRK